MSEKEPGVRDFKWYFEGLAGSTIALISFVTDEISGSTEAISCGKNSFESREVYFL